MEQELISSEQRYRSLVESLPNITLKTDYEGYFLEYHIEETLQSNHFSNNFFSESKMIGKQIFSIHPGFEALIREKLLKQWKECRNRSFTNQSVETFEYILTARINELF